MKSNTVIVTGSSAGAGRAIALHFGARGWRVGVIARDERRLSSVCRQIEAMGGEALTLPADVSDAAALLRCRDKAFAAWGAIDAWVNAAMVTVVAPVPRVTPDEYRRVMEVTFLGCVHGTLAALEVMRTQGHGSIVQVGSALAYRAIPLQSAYCAAKFAVRGFTDSLRTELLHQRSAVRLSMVQLPAMNTPQFDWARNKLSNRYQPLGRIYQPEIAAQAVYRAVTTGARELWVGRSAIQAIVGQLFGPSMLDRLMAARAWTGQISDETELPGRPDNLEHTVHGDYGAHGRFGNRAVPDARILDPHRARLAIVGALVGVATLVLAKALPRRL